MKAQKFAANYSKTQIEENLSIEDEIDEAQSKENRDGTVDYLAVGENKRTGQVSSRIKEAVEMEQNLDHGLG